MDVVGHQAIALCVEAEALAVLAEEFEVRTAVVSPHSEHSRCARSVGVSQGCVYRSQCPAGIAMTTRTTAVASLRRLAVFELDPPLLRQLYLRCDEAECRPIGT